MSQLDEFLPHFVPSSSYTKFIPWDGFHLYMGKNNTPLPGLNFSCLQMDFQTIDRIVSSCIIVNFKPLKYKIYSKEAKTTQQAVARRHGGGCSVIRRSLQPCGDLEPFLIVVGPLCLFLIVVGARHHPLALPNLQAGACSGGNGWWVGIVTLGGLSASV
jgi:hypothetical protein